MFNLLLMTVLMTANGPVTKTETVKGYEDRYECDAASIELTRERVEDGAVRSVGRCSTIYQDTDYSDRVEQIK